jgi:succinate-semialdehyde dehydrogenase/glutarate-semialdehyde dehydrogenase
MLGIEERLEQVHRLIAKIKEKREELILIAVRDTGFTHRECSIEVDVNLKNLQGFKQMVSTFAARQPLCGPEQEIALILPYNGSAWLNTAIVSIYLVGNRVRVKFASRGSEIASFTESVYQPIFADAIRFDYVDGRTFMENAITDPQTPAICLFGTDAYAGRYRDSIRNHQKKFVFEGPGKDPFIVLPGGDLEAAAHELAEAKYIYAGQTCTAPERVYLHESIHEEFLHIFLELSGKLKLGNPEDPTTEMGPVASPRVIANIKAQLEDAEARGGRIVLGGKIEGNLVYPTVVVDATHDMLGMRDETFGPVSFIQSFSATEEVIRLAKDNRYGLRAAIYGEEQEAQKVGEKLVGESYCHPVEEMRFGVFGTIAVNQPRSESWQGAFVSKPVGGYGYSGWIWETIDGQFITKQGAKLLSIETSIED